MNGLRVHTGSACMFGVILFMPGVVVGGDRDMAQEVSDFAACRCGPGGTPAPGGVLTPQACIDFFDYDDDSDVDLRDYRVYLATVPVDAEPAIQIGSTFGTPFIPYEDGSILNLYTGGQGFTHMFLTVRGFRFPPDVSVDVERVGILTSTGGNVLTDQAHLNVAFTGVGVGVDQSTTLFVVTFLAPGMAEGEELVLTVTVTTRDLVPPLEASTTVAVNLHEDF